MPVEIYFKTGFGRRLRTITTAAAASLTKLYANLYSSLDLAAPVNSSAPVIAGSTTVGSTLTVTPGVWTGDPTPVLTYQWQNGGVDIGGETGTTLDTTGLSASDEITCVETATNSQGTQTATSNTIILT